jgi:hypothetical protein
MEHGMKYLIVNVQHNISTSKLLQETLVYAVRREEFQTYNAYIVYSLHKNKLEMISEWCNSCNHLKHSQSTLGTNILSAWNMWEMHDWPISQDPKRFRDCRNKSVFNTAKFEVFTSFNIEMTFLSLLISCFSNFL